MRRRMWIVLRDDGKPGLIGAPAMVAACPAECVIGPHLMCYGARKMSCVPIRRQMTCT